MGFSVLDYFFLNQNACWHWKDTYVLRYYRMFYLLYVGLEHVYDTFSDGKINNENDVFRIAITAVLGTNYLVLV